MGMGVDKGGHDDAALGVQQLGVGVFGPQRGLLAHLDNLRALEGHSALLEIGLRGIAGNQPAVVQ